MKLNKDNLYKLVEGQVRNELKKKIQIKEDMNRNRVRLTESQLHNVIKESVKKVLREDGMLGDNPSRGAVLGKGVSTIGTKNDFGGADKMVYDIVKKLASVMPNGIGSKINNLLGKYKSASDIKNQIDRIISNYGDSRLSKRDMDDFNEYMTYQ